ncbi:MAG: sigma-70 family RNA polymerase sigma factor [Candidatus Anammoximicrobium sp.]|nr:sigma-70 family RNA polymerase sigma factor [Candidatus Anammoximicrobium sp.]
MIGQASAGPVTSATLLDRIRDLKNQQDWERFIAIYGSFLTRFLRRRGLTHDDALDVVQETFVTLVDHIGDFRYDPEKRFRGWLATVALRKAWRYLDRQGREPAGAGGTTHQAIVEGIPGRDGDDRTERLEAVLDRVRAEVPPLEWDVFRLTVLEDIASKVAAEQLHIEIGYLYVCRSRVKRVLRRILEQGDE